VNYADESQPHNFVGEFGEKYLKEEGYSSEEKKIIDFLESRLECGTIHSTQNVARRGDIVLVF